MDKLGEKLEKFSGVLVGAFGDKALIGVALELLRDVTPGEAYDCIVNCKTIDQIDGADWPRYRRLTRKINMDAITIDLLIAKLARRRRDLLGIIENTPGGIEWLDNQLKTIKSKLSLTP